MHPRLRLALVLALSACGQAGPSADESGDRTLPFDPAAWRAADSADRGRMCPSLMSSHELVGMSLDDVAVLLGPPDSSNHLVWYWVGPPDPETGPGRFKVYFRDSLVSSFQPDCLPQPRPEPVPFERERWLVASAEDRYAMLQGALALEADYLGRPRADVEDFFGPPSERSHEVEYFLSPAKQGGWVARMLTLTVDVDGRISEATDRVVNS